MKTNKKQRKNSNGITLIALVITIIVLLILAGVSISMLTGDNGILTQAQNAKNRTEEAQKEEENTLNNYESYLNSYSGINTEFTDSLGNKVIIPEGFRVLNPGDNVEDGIIIEDVTHGATAGSQFVWIPVGENIKKEDGSKFDIILGRYIYKEDGTIDTELSKTKPTDQLKTNSTNLYYYTEGLKDTVTLNTHAKDIEEFIECVTKNGGYYIARYEARTQKERTVSTDDEELTQLTLKPDEYVYNYVTQSQAASLSQGMYVENSNFISDLMNSYAWDTAVDFLQKCDNREGINKKPYSMQSSLNNSLAKKGTNNESTKDQICNIFDMASNCYEWITETHSNDYYPCVLRGCSYSLGSNYTVYRNGYSEINSYDNNTFRPILYIK